MALIAALFLTIVIAALGVFAMRIGTDQQQAATLSLLGFRASAAARSGLEFGSNRAFNGICGVDTLVIGNFTVTVRCSVTSHDLAGVSYSVHDLAATAAQGVYGSPDFVRRTLTRRVSNIPPGVW
jgi:MSHA biogenesis protein MshP